MDQNIMAKIIHSLVNDPKKLELLNSGDYNLRLNKDELGAIKNVFSRYSLSDSGLLSAIGPNEYWA